MNTKRFVLIISSCSLFALSGVAAAGVGNGYPTGPHFNLQFIGKNWENLNKQGHQTGDFSCPSEASYKCETVDGNPAVGWDDGGNPVSDYGSAATVCASGVTGCVELSDASWCVGDDPNVVYLPRETTSDKGTEVSPTVALESGNTRFKGKNKDAGFNTYGNLIDLDNDGIPELTVTDWCTEPFKDDGTISVNNADGAAVMLPPPNYFRNESGDRAVGYEIFGRLLGKPFTCGWGEPEGGGDPVYSCEESSFQIASAGLCIVNDGNQDLLALGLITPNGALTPACDVDLDGDDINDLYYRVTDDANPDKKGKGAKKAQKASNLTNALYFNGNVCYLREASNIYYCGVDTTIPADGVNDEMDWNNLAEGCTGPNYLCCTDAVDESGGTPVAGQDGVYEACVAATDEQIDDEVDRTGYPPDGVNSSGSIVLASTADGTCGTDEDLNQPFVVSACKDWVSQWIFEIGDFVQVLLGLDNNSYNMKVRLYPSYNPTTE